jgi:hypothetical protein
MGITSGNSLGMFTNLYSIIFLIIQYTTGLVLNQKALWSVTKGESNGLSVYKEIIREFDYYQFVKRKWLLFFADGPGLLGLPIREPS